MGSASILCRKAGHGLGVLVASTVAFAIPIEAQDAYVSPSTLKKLSVEELVDIDVTSVSKYPEKFSAAAAAVAVLTQEDIHRSGVTNVPDALRLVPGLDVARVDSHTWAISSRGFNDIYANKLLVMIDGRTVYTPLFSGVFWDVQDTLLEDIDRIEVVRGPGATLWGANAVNGVINIITKSARDTQGLLLSGGGGTEDRGFTNIRYGVKVTDEAFLKVYAKYFNRDSSVLSNGDAHTMPGTHTAAGFVLIGSRAKRIRSRFKAIFTPTMKTKRIPCRPRRFPSPAESHRTMTSRAGIC